MKTDQIDYLILQYFISFIGGSINFFRSTLVEMVRSIQLFVFSYTIQHLITRCTVFFWNWFTFKREASLTFLTQTLKRFAAQKSKLLHIVLMNFVIFICSCNALFRLEQRRTMLILINSENCNFSLILHGPLQHFVFPPAHCEKSFIIKHILTFLRITHMAPCMNHICKYSDHPIALTLESNSSEDWSSSFSSQKCF